MTSCSEIMGLVEEWLRSGRPDADNLIDFPWEIEKEDGVLVAVHPKFPLRIRLVCSEDAKSIRASTWLAIPTIVKPNETRLILYRKMLRMNTIPLAKYMLVGDEDYIGAAVDLSIESLGKKEFNDALAFLLTAINSIASEIGETEELYRQMLEELIRLVKKHFEEGWGWDKMVRYLVEYVGMNREEAEGFLTKIGMRPPRAGKEITM